MGHFSVICSLRHIHSLCLSLFLGLLGIGLWFTLNPSSLGAAPGENLILKEPSKPHKIYDMTLHLPQSWKVDKQFNENPGIKYGSLMAVDQNKTLTYPRNLEVRVIDETIYADSHSEEKLKTFIPRKFSKAHRGIQNYKIEGSEIVKVGGTEEAILLFSSFRLAEDDMSHIHVALPRKGYYFLLTYTDIKSLVHTTSESYEVFWNILQQIEMPSSSLFTHRTSGLMVVFIALAALLATLLCFSYLRKRRSMRKLSELGIVSIEKVAKEKRKKKVKVLPKKITSHLASLSPLTSTPPSSTLEETLDHDPLTSLEITESEEDKESLFGEEHEKTLLSNLLDSHDDAVGR